MEGEMELTDTEIDALVAAVPEEVALTSNEDDVDLDFEQTVADEAADETQLSTASSVDTSATVMSTQGSNDQQSHGLTAEAVDKAVYKTDEAETLSASPVADIGPQTIRTVPGKAIPVAADSISPELAVVDQKSAGSPSDPLDTTTVQLESVGSSGSVSSAVPTVDSGMKSKNSQHSKKQDNKSLPSPSGKGWGWTSLGSWSSSVLSTATSFTSHVGESFYHVLETVESSLVEPEDESVSKTFESHNVTETTDLHAETSTQGETFDAQHSESKYQEHVRQQHPQPRVNKEQSDDDVSAADSKQLGGKTKDAAERWDATEGSGWLPGWNLSSLAELTGAFTNTGKRMVNSGLEVIGDISKKTYSILIEDDEDSSAARRPNVKKKLSTKETSRAALYQDDAGVAHYEALEELSRWSRDTLAQQLSAVRGKSADAVHDDLALINDSFHLGDFNDIVDASDKEHDFVRLVTDFVGQLGLQLNVSKLVETQANTRKWLVERSLKVPELQQLEPQVVYESAVQSFSDLTSASVALYHKVAQLLLIENNGNPLLSYKFRALSLVGLTKVLCFELYIQSSQFAHLLLSGNTQSDVIKSLVDGINLEASQSAKHLQQACSHLLPIMQLAVSRMRPLLSDYSAGIAHLEGLQVLSNMSQNNVRDVLSQFDRETRRSVETHLANIEASFDLGYLQAEDETEQEDATFSSRTMQLVQQLTTETEAVQKLITVQQRIRKYLKDCKRDESLGHVNLLTNDVHQTAMQSLTDWTAVSVELYYSIAQSMLLDQPCDVSLYAQKSATLASLTKLLCIEVGHVSSQFTHCLSAAASLSDSATPFVTNIYLEASSSSTCIQDGLQLLLPIVQLALLKAQPVCQQSAASSTADQ